MRTERAESALQLILLLAVGGVAAAASWSHVISLAGAHGQGGWLAYAVAAVTETLAVSMGLEMRRRRRADVSTLFPATFLVGAVGLQLAAQLAEAEPTAWGRILAAVPCVGFLVLVKVAGSRVHGVATKADTERAENVDEKSGGSAEPEHLEEAEPAAVEPEKVPEPEPEAEPEPAPALEPPAPALHSVPPLEPPDKTERIRIVLAEQDLTRSGASFASKHGGNRATWNTAKRDAAEYVELAERLTDLAAEQVLAWAGTVALPAPVDNADGGELAVAGSGA